MDCIDEHHRVMVIGATNCPDLNAPALLRPGRFDHVVDLNTPENDDRCTIL